MDDLVKRSIKTANEQRKKSVSWEFDKPWKQSFYIYSSNQQKWVSPNTSNEPSATSQSPSSDISQLALYSWNIDFMLPFPDSRMHIALLHLQKEHIEKLDSQTASVIFLQECLESDVQLIASNPWVQQTFALTDIDTSNWQSGYYGTISLIDLRLPITNSFRLHFSQTRFQRDGLFVDIQFSHERKIFRLCNTHLESLALDPPYRPPQMELVAKYMHDSAVHGAAVAGDFNAIQDFDLHLHSDNQLSDAYLTLGGDEDDAEGGHTWGQQAATVQRERFGTSRMDKVFFCGGVRCTGFERFGAGVELEDEGEQREIVELGFDRPWITDHIGVKAVFELAEGVVGHKSSL